MIKGLIATIIVLVLLLLGAGFAIKQQMKVNGEQKEIIKTQQASLDEAIRLKDVAEKAVAERDKLVSTAQRVISQYRARMKKLEEQYAEIADWAKQPLPGNLVKFMCDFTHSRSETCMPTGNAGAGKGVARVDRNG